jgi:hypothetical protein
VFTWEHNTHGTGGTGSANFFEYSKKKIIKFWQCYVLKMCFKKRYVERGSP